MATREDLARIIIKALCDNKDCVLTIGELNRRLGGAHNILCVIEEFPGIFSISQDPQTTEKLVSIHMPVPLCRNHCSIKAECIGWPNCTSLHICKFFLLSDCRRRDCPFGHVLKTGHNTHVLARFLLDGLEDDEIQCILRKVDNRTFVTKPDVCNSYNIAKGCDRSNCAFLHVCKHFLENTCKFEQSCKRSHDITTPGAVSTLRRFGINMDRSLELVLQDLRVMFESPDLPMTRNNSMASLTGSTEQKPPVKDRSRSARRQLGGRERSVSLNPPRTTVDGTRPKIRGQNPDLSSMPHRPQDPLGRRPSFDVLQQFPRQGQSQGQPMQAEGISKNKANPDICLFNLSRFCFRKYNCSHLHKSMIYQWQYDLKGWKDFDIKTNEDIEMYYCDPSKEKCYVEWKESEVAMIRFTEPMETTTGSLDSKMAVRRLSTVSSVHAPPGKYKWTTEWRWYWNLDGIWLLYGEKDIIGAKSNMDSDVIEERYLQDPKSSIEFKTSEFRYKLDFETMTQKNLDSGSSRSVVRRPVFFKKGDLLKRKCPIPSHVEPVPKDWSIPKFRSAKTLLGHFETVKLEETSEEYKQVADLFSKTMPRDKLRRIARVESGEMWTNFSRRRNDMMNKASDMKVKELSLFHGTDEDNVQSICRQGFDFRFSGSRVGAKLGKGSYFARDAKYSSCYSTRNERGYAKMFVAKVLVGEYEVGNPSFVRPPPKKGFEQYDSCVDDKFAPSIFVVFTLDQAYPEYLITYKDVKKGE